MPTFERQPEIAAHFVGVRVHADRMCWMCDNPDAGVDDYFEVLRKIIARSGWAIQFVESDPRPFAYTVGLHEKGLPELLITGLPPQPSARLLNAIAARTTDGSAILLPAMRLDQDEMQFEVVEVDHPDVHLRFAVGLFDAPIRALQLVWTDDKSHWPWDRGWSHGRRRQPVFGVRAQAPE